MGSPSAGYFGRPKGSFGRAVPTCSPVCFARCAPLQEEPKGTAEKREVCCQTLYFFPFRTCNWYVLVALVLLFNTSHTLCK